MVAKSVWPAPNPGGSTHHEVVELRGAGHELGPAHSHADLHEARVLAGLGLPHLTHDPAEDTRDPVNLGPPWPWAPQALQRCPPGSGISGTSREGAGHGWLPAGAPPGSQELGNLWGTPQKGLSSTDQTLGPQFTTGHSAVQRVLAKSRTVEEPELAEPREAR